jgi:hypothetical protein
VPLSYYKIDPIRASLAEAGFGDLRVAVRNREKEVTDFESFAFGMVYGNPLIDMIRTRGGVDPNQVVDSLAQALRRAFGDPGKIPIPAIVFDAMRR